MVAVFMGGLLAVVVFCVVMGLGGVDGVVWGQRYLIGQEIGPAFGGWRRYEAFRLEWQRGAPHEVSGAGNQDVAAVGGNHRPVDVCRLGKTPEGLEREKVRFCALSPA